MSDAAFRTVLRGYDPTEVDHYLGTVRESAEAARVVAAERTVELEKARTQHSQTVAEVEALRQQVAELQESAKTSASPTFADLGERIGQILGLAQEESEHVRRHAAADADGLLQEARGKAERIEAQAQAHADELTSRTEAEVARRLSDAQRRADEILDVADRESAARREEAEAVYERQRARAAAAATEFETTLAERRDHAATEFARALAAQDQSLAAAEERLNAVEKEAQQRKADSEREADQLMTDARAQSEQLVQEARETAEKIRRESERELAAASHQREAITAQLSNVRQMLATIGGGAHGAAALDLVDPAAQSGTEPEETGSAVDESEAPSPAVGADSADDGETPDDETVEQTDQVEETSEASAQR